MSNIQKVLGHLINIRLAHLSGSQNKIDLPNLCSRENLGANLIIALDNFHMQNSLIERHANRLT